MTQKELSKLTPDQKRIRIAEILGIPMLKTFWKYSHWRSASSAIPCKGWPSRASCDQDRSAMQEMGNYCSEIEEYEDANPSIPDFLNDLNAMHDAEKTIHGDKDAWIIYIENLVGIDDIIHATAANKADAFLLTKG